MMFNIAGEDEPGVKFVGGVVVYQRTEILRLPGLYES